MSRGRCTPPLLIRQSTSGWSSVTFSMKEEMKGMSPVSRVYYGVEWRSPLQTVCNFESVRPTMMTFLPGAISHLDRAKPMPPPPPVTTAHLNSRFLGDILVFGCQIEA